MIYITGDTHGEFARVHKFCQKIGTAREDVLIILGDAAINDFGDERDTKHNRINPDYLSSEFPKFMEKNDFRRMRFHDTRHTAATNIHPAHRRLLHSGRDLGVYAHLLSRRNLTQW